LGDIDKVYRIIREQQGRLDVLIANAGIGEFCPLGQIAEEHFDKQFDVNVKGTLFTVQGSCLASRCASRSEVCAGPPQFCALHM
jgi:NAD(P)-dependent dehydrogenase (short-subunit alcohol dehydrogenase family)